jgi:hypothetical protein
MILLQLLVALLVLIVLWRHIGFIRATLFVLACACFAGVPAWALVPHLPEWTQWTSTKLVSAAVMFILAGVFMVRDKKRQKNCIAR